jgi:actin-related protein 5
MTPFFTVFLIIEKSQWMLHNFCEFAIDYPVLLRTFNDPVKLNAASRIVQFPFTPPILEDKTDEELARIAERKREQGRKLQETAAKMRIEKVSIKMLDV